MDEQISMIRRRAKTENQLPPKDMDKRKRDIGDWKRKVGWAKMKTIITVVLETGCYEDVYG